MIHRYKNHSKKKDIQGVLLSIQGGFIPFQNEITIAGKIFQFLRRRKDKDQKNDNDDLFPDLFAEKKKDKNLEYRKYILSLPAVSLAIVIYLFKEKLFGNPKNKYGAIILTGKTKNPLGITRNYSFIERIGCLINHKLIYLLKDHINQIYVYFQHELFNAK